MLGDDVDGARGSDVRGDDGHVGGMRRWSGVRVGHCRRRRRGLSHFEGAGWDRAADDLGGATFHPVGGDALVEVS